MKVRFGAHPASYAMGTGSFPGVKRPGRGVDYSPPSSAEVKKRVVLYLYSHSGPSKPVLPVLPFLPRRKNTEPYDIRLYNIISHYYFLCVKCLTEYDRQRPKHVVGLSHNCISFYLITAKLQ